MWYYQKFPLETRQAALFDAKQRYIEHSADFLETLTNMVSSADWTTISPEKATCYIFIHGVTKNIDKQMCVNFLQEGKSDLQELKEELKKSKIQQPKLIEIFVVPASIGSTRMNNAVVSATFVINEGIPHKIALRVLKKSR